MVKKEKVEVEEEETSAVEEEISTREEEIPVFDVAEFLDTKKKGLSAKQICEQYKISTETFVKARKEAK